MKLSTGVLYLNLSTNNNDRITGTCRQPQTYVKPEVAITVFELLMMSGVSLETCWAIKKHWNNKFYYTVASCWLFL
jgi:predicted DCC family thiol-disulfide oxidoreductase YuxK